MSPEQALGKPADERSDIYSLGCVLYAMLAGHPPFTGDATAAILNQHANIAPAPVRTENARVPPQLDALVMQMLAKSPDDRPQTAAQVRDRLASLGAAPRRTAAPPRRPRGWTEPPSLAALPYCRTSQATAVDRSRARSPRWRWRLC